MAESGVYETKPVRIQAIKFTGKNGKEVREWTDKFFEERGRYWFVTDGMTASTGKQAWRYIIEGDDTWPKDAHAAVYDFLHERWIPVFENQWIIRGGLEGEFYPCADSTFHGKYKKVG